MGVEEPKASVPREEHKGTGTRECSNLREAEGYAGLTLGD